MTGMSRTIARQAPPAPGAAEALFAQARRRRRRLRLAGAVVILALAVSVGVAFAVSRPHRAAVARDAGGGGAGPAGAAVAGRVAWVDYNGRVHLGDLATSAQRVIAKINADPALPLVQAGGRLYWVSWAGARRPGRGPSAAGGPGTEPGDRQDPGCGGWSVGLPVRRRAAPVYLPRGQPPH